jgi:O-antigen/teichoic acid export membrane protein
MQALRLAVAPQISRMLTTGDTDGVEKVHHTSATWIVLMSFPLYLVFATWPGQVLSLFGREFLAGAPALTVLALALLVNMGTGNVSTVLLMSGRSGLTLAITAGSLALGISLTFLFTPWLGVLGAALAKGTAVVFENLAVAVAVRRTVGVRTVNRPLLVAVAVSAVCFVLPALALRAVPGIDSGSPAVAVLGTLAGSAFYAMFLWRLRALFEFAALSAVVPGRLARLFRRPAPVDIPKGSST